jgi:hypothetical protein
MVETPETIKNAILIVLPEFMKCSDPTIWEERFMKIYKATNISEFDDATMLRDPIYYFLEEGLRFIKSQNIIYEVLIDCLNNFESVTNYQNSLIIASVYGKGSFIFEDEISNILRQLIPTATKSTQYYILLNLYRFFSDELKDLCDKQFSQISLDSLEDEILLGGISATIQISQELKKKLKKVSLSSSKLWATGKKNNNGQVSYGFPIERIEINEIQEKIDFDSEEIKVIYDKMVISLVDLEEYFVKHRSGKSSRGDIFNWEDILLMMRLFIKRNKLILANEIKFEENIKKVDFLYLQEIGSKTISESLLSVDDQIIDYGIERLYHDVLNSDIGNFETEYIIIANAIISLKKQKLYRYFDHFVWAISKYKDSFEQEIFSSLLELVLNVYRPFYEDKDKSWNLSAKKDNIEKNLIKINNILNTWGINNEFWDNYTPRFYPLL